MWVEDKIMHVLEASVADLNATFIVAFLEVRSIHQVSAGYCRQLPGARGGHHVLRVRCNA